MEERPAWGVEGPPSPMGVGGSPIVKPSDRPADVDGHQKGLVLMGGVLPRLECCQLERVRAD